VRAAERPVTRTLAVCADDFGLAPELSRSIAQLAQRARLTAVSCITNSAHWAGDAALLEALPASVDVGLHLNLTEGVPISARLARRWPRLPGLPRLIAQAHLGLLPISEIRVEVHAQLAAFSQARGEPPAFIDGHQHVHHLPAVRDMILDMVEHVQPLPAVRSTGRLLGPGHAVKRWLIEATGGRALARQLQRRVLAHNSVLLGAYDFVQTDYRRLMQGWLRALPPGGGLLFCHPGRATGAGWGDPIAAAREREWAYFDSPAFVQDLAAADVALGNLWPRVRLRREAST
jgi:predicted glycoside hydrolase/deacetylase ChbG (UPF0249 family)